MGLEKLPAPDSYTLPSPFGKEGIHYTMRADPDKSRSNLFLVLISLVDKMYSKLGNLPGPGDYKYQEIMGNTSRSKLTSVMHTPIATSFPLYKDRFGIPTLRHKSPGPGTHTPKIGFTEQ